MESVVSALLCPEVEGDGGEFVDEGAARPFLLRSMDLR